MLKLSRFLILLLLCGCAATTESRLDSLRANYMVAPVSDDFNADDNLSLLINADALFHNGDYAKSDAT